MAATLTDTLIEQGLSEFLRLRLQIGDTPATPAAGAEWSLVVPGGVIWELLAVQDTLVTSAVVQNRTPALKVANADGVLRMRFTPNATQAASLTRTSTWMPAANVNAVAVDVNQVLPIIPVVLLPGWSIGSDTVNLDAGDQYSALHVIAREWSPDQIAKQARWVARNLGTDVIYQGAI